MVTVTRPARPPGDTRTKCVRCPQTPAIAALRAPIHWALRATVRRLAATSATSWSPAAGSETLRTRSLSNGVGSEIHHGFFVVLLNVRLKTVFRFAVQGWRTSRSAATRSASSGKKPET